MKSFIYTLVLAGSMAGLNFCKTDAKSKDAEKQNSDSTVVVKEPAIVKELAPPDTDYTGDFFKKYENGVIKARGYFRFGQRDGKWMYFFPDGKLWSEATFERGKMSGPSNVYHPNGKLYYSGAYLDDKPVGTWNFYDSTGTFAATKKYDSVLTPKEPK